MYFYILLKRRKVNLTEVYNASVNCDIPNTHKNYLHMVLYKMDWLTLCLVTQHLLRDVLANYDIYIEWKYNVPGVICEIDGAYRTTNSWPFMVVYIRLLRWRLQTFYREPMYKQFDRQHQYYIQRIRICRAIYWDMWEKFEETVCRCSAGFPYRFDRLKSRASKFRGPPAKMYNIFSNSCSNFTLLNPWVR